MPRIACSAHPSEGTPARVFDNIGADCSLPSDFDLRRLCGPRHWRTPPTPGAMRKAYLRLRLRPLRLVARPHRADSSRRLNDAPRAPPIPTSDRISDASSSFTDVSLDDRMSVTESPRLSLVSHDTVCLICLDQLPRGALATRLPCAHAAWHPKCLARWLKTASRCPLCNDQVPAKRPCYRERVQSSELPWTLSERREPEVHLPVRSRDSTGSGDFLFAGTGVHAADMAWSLHDRRLSSASRPTRPHQRRFGRSISLMLN